MQKHISVYNLSRLGKGHKILTPVLLMIDETLRVTFNNCIKRSQTTQLLSLLLMYGSWKHWVETQFTFPCCVGDQCTVLSLEKSNIWFASSPPLCHLQASRDPLSPEGMAEIFEDTKDMGVLIGKGGIYGQVLAFLSLEKMNTQKLWWVNALTFKSTQPVNYNSLLFSPCDVKRKAINHLNCHCNTFSTYGLLFKLQDFLAWFTESNKSLTSENQLQ